LLATEFRDRVSWPRVEIFWGDERYLPHTDPRSDYRMARDALLAHVPIPGENVHPMPTDSADPEEAAQAYERLLRAHFPCPWPRFNLVLLGLGAEGHTASLFPHSPALLEQARWVVATEAPVEPKRRLTLTLPAINHATHIWFLVAGAEKTEALKCALAEEADVMSCPAAGVKPTNGELVWWVDEEAAGRSAQQPRSSF
jgi:6-phosphogluconolactonase